MMSDAPVVEPHAYGQGTWEREARRLTLLAAELGLVVDPEALILSDIRDLMTLRVRLQARLNRKGRRQWGRPWARSRPGGML